MDEHLGLSDHDKELRKWNQPYVYREFPRMLFRGGASTTGRITVEQRIVESEGELAVAEGQGWRKSPEVARQDQETRQEAVGIAAAERAYTDQAMSPSAQAEAAAADGATARHLGAIPERPMRRPHRATPKETV